MRLKTTLDQWQTLYEIDRAGSIQAAALQLNKSHTTLIYALRKLEDQLGVSLVQVKVVGRCCRKTENRCCAERVACWNKLESWS